MEKNQSSKVQQKKSGEILRSVLIEKHPTS